MRKTQNLTLTKTATGTKKTNGYTLICHIIAHQLGWGRHCLKAKEKALMGQTFWLDAEIIAYKPFIYTVLYVSTGFVDLDLVVYLLFLWCLRRVSDWPHKNWHARTRTQTPTLNASKSAETSKRNTNGWGQDSWLYACAGSAYLVIFPNT